MSKQIASKLPVSGRPICTYPAGINSSDKLFLGADASATYWLESESHPKNVIPSKLNGRNEYLDKNDSNDRGSRFRSLSSKTRSRNPLSSARIGTPCSLTIAAKRSINASVLAGMFLDSMADRIAGWMSCYPRSQKRDMGHPALRSDIAGLGSNVTGTWTVEMSVPSGRILGTVELTQNGNQVSGWLDTKGGDRIPLSGAVLSDGLTITTHPESRGRVAFDRCEVRTGSNHMKGKSYPGGGKIEFRRVREPHPASRPRSWH